MFWPVMSSWSAKSIRDLFSKTFIVFTRSRGISWLIPPSESSAIGSPVLPAVPVCDCVGE